MYKRVKRLWPIDLMPNLYYPQRKGVSHIIWSKKVFSDSFNFYTICSKDRRSFASTTNLCTFTSAGSAITAIQQDRLGMGLTRHSTRHRSGVAGGHYPLSSPPPVTCGEETLLWWTGSQTSSGPAAAGGKNGVEDRKRKIISRDGIRQSIAK